MGVDPAELRRRNTIPPDAMPFKTGLVFTYDCGAFEKNMDMALAMADYTGFARRREAARAQGKLRGIGMSNTIERAGAEGVEWVEIRFDRMGTATVLSGSVAQGQGHETMYKQFANDRLGIDPADVHYLSADTDKVPYGQGSFGSRSATIGGTAFHMAAEKIVAKAKGIVAHLLQTSPEEVSFDDGVFTAPGTNRTLTIGDVARTAFKPETLPDGMEPGLIESAVFSATETNFPNGAHVCEVEIDEETGKAAIVNYSVVDDVGTVINPLMLKGQIHGGIAQGVGQILMEDIRYDESGQLLTGSFMDYCMPRADDLSFMAVDSNPVPTATNPLGVKGAGEAGNVGALPAVANALVDALSVYGIRHIGMPATPERIWRALRDAKAAGAQ
jgi:carbon-monoxide dehydrogenase large subunit